LAVGDAQFQKKCLGKMQDVSKNEGRTVLFVSHNMGVIAQLCNRGILLNKGKVESNEEIDIIINNYVSGNLNSGKSYLLEENPSKKKNYFTKIYTGNNSYDIGSQFSFRQSVTLSFEFKAEEIEPNLNIGIALLNKFQQKVFTVVKPVQYFKSVSNKYKGSVEIPSSIIAPGDYSFNLIIWIKDVKEYDFVENICCIKIYDDGTEYAIYEGYDYGSIILNVNWVND